MTKAIVLLCDIFMQIVPNYGKCAIVRDSTLFDANLICFGFYFAIRRTTQFTSLFGFYIHRWICLFINNSKTSACLVKMLQRYIHVYQWGNIGTFGHFLFKLCV